MKTKPTDRRRAATDRHNRLAQQVRDQQTRINVLAGLLNQESLQLVNLQAELTAAAIEMTTT